MSDLVLVAMMGFWGCHGRADGRLETSRPRQGRFPEA
jgi:hypothetical protein